MSDTTVDLTSLPQFTTDAEGKPKAVTLETAAYIALLVKASITDPTLWPPGMEKGATALARVRQIEAECLAQYGEFDWEKLPEAVQDEYDGLCALLDSLQDTGERIPLRDLLQVEGKTRASPMLSSCRPAPSETNVVSHPRYVTASWLPSSPWRITHAHRGS